MHPVQSNFLPPQGQQAKNAAAATAVDVEQTVPTTETESGSRPSSDQIQLSPEAVRFLDSGDKQRGPHHRDSFAPPGHEKAGHSTAAQARAIIEADPSLAELPFGQVVSQVARGTLSLADVTPDETGDETVGETVDETGGETVSETGDETGGTQTVGGPAAREEVEGEIPLADGPEAAIVTASTSEPIIPAPPEVTDPSEPGEPAFAPLIEETVSPEAQLLRTPIVAPDDTSLSDGELIDLLTEEGIDQTV